LLLPHRKPEKQVEGVLVASRKEERREKLQRELDRMLKRLIERGVEKVILFGSFARGEVNSWSDLDLLVVMKSEKPYFQRWDEVYLDLMPCVGTDLLVYTPEEFEQMQQRSPTVRSAVREGKVVYAARP
jgi:predicted nucleotidyltransferase